MVQVGGGVSPRRLGKEDPLWNLGVWGRREAPTVGLNSTLHEGQAAGPEGWGPYPWLGSPGCAKRPTTE